MKIHHSFIVTCLNDLRFNGKTGRRILATHRLFKTRLAAIEYTNTIAYGREPLVEPCAVLVGVSPLFDIFSDDENEVRT